MSEVIKTGNIDLLSGKVAILGYGSQGHAHALNLADSGIDVVVGLKPDSASRAAAEEAGLKVADVAEAVRGAQLVALLVPDGPQADLFRDEVAPKAPGHRVRELYVSGAGTPGLVAIQQDASGRALQLALAYGVGIGCGRVGLLETTFAEDTESDLFGEQAVLCGGVPALVQAGFDTLVAAGYQPEIAYYECLNELKLIVDLLYEGGFEYMRYSISDVAEYGDLSVGTVIVDDGVRERMQGVLERIRSGAFAKELFEDDAAGRPRFKELREQGQKRAAELEKVGKELRELAGAEGLHGVGAGHPAQ